MDPNWQLARKQPILVSRARILEKIRAFFIAQGFIEVETPHRLPGNAPELHIDPVSSDGWFLQTSPELCMKRLLAAGYDKIFQICRCWRAGERGPHHLPEYTMLEWYRRDCDYQQLMKDCEGLILSLTGNTGLVWQANKVDLTPPWPRLSVTEAFSQHSSTPLNEVTDVNFFSELISNEVEPCLPKNKPLFLVNYPALQGSLARTRSQNPDEVERFELFIAGLELANGFSELTDPKEQSKRFEDEERLRRAAGKPATPFPDKYIADLQTLSDAAGIALGVDRLLMLLCDCPSIDEVVCFTPEQL